MRKLLVIILLTIQYCGLSQSLDFSMLRAINKNEHPNWDKTMKITSSSIYPAMAIAPGSLLLTGYINDDKIMMRNGVKTGVAICLNQCYLGCTRYKPPSPFCAIPK